LDGRDRRIRLGGAVRLTGVRCILRGRGIGRTGRAKLAQLLTQIRDQILNQAVPDFDLRPQMVRRHASGNSCIETEHQKWLAELQPRETTGRVPAVDQFERQIALHLKHGDESKIGEFQGIANKPDDLRSMGAIMTGRLARSIPSTDQRLTTVDLQPPGGTMGPGYPAPTDQRYAEAYAAAGRGDYASSIRLWRRFANEGDAMSQYNLGQMYEAGQGVTRDFAQAAEWYRRAAESGIPHARLSLGVAYALGRGVPQDFLQAHKWLNLAVAAYTTDEDRGRAIRARDLVATRMSSHDIAEAQRLAREWQLQSAR
jgi:uncharacterized protein